jgi:prepilin-type N-terminal cleavage/methylation domain-containing protein
MGKKSSFLTGASRSSARGARAAELSQNALLHGAAAGNHFPPCRPGGRAFTLIELLIVVAIIAILAAIAVPNFLEAQTRAKIARVKVDMRTLSVGLEAYVVDHNHYPQADNNGWPRWLIQISTPVAYVTDAHPLDPFENLRGPRSQYVHPVLYYGMNETHALNTYFPGQLYRPSPSGSRRIVWYLLESVGPDRQRNNYGDGTLIAKDNLQDASRFIRFLYDPTNGTTSWGDIIRPGGAPSGISAIGLRGAGL